MIKHKVATGLIARYMLWKGYYGYTSYWNTIYYRTEAHMNTQTLRNHELKHMEQIDELGKIRFTVEYMYQSIRYGYMENKFEIAARKAEKDE